MPEASDLSGQMPLDATSRVELQAADRRVEPHGDTHRNNTKARAVLARAQCVRRSSDLADADQACMRCCELPWPRMPLMRSTSLRGLNGLVM